MRYCIKLAVLFGLAVAAANPVCYAQIEGVWDARIECPGGDIRFGLELGLRKNRLTGFLVNGSERIPIPKVSFQDNTLILDIDHYDSRIEMKLVDGALDGEWTKRRGLDKWSTLKLSASPNTANGKLQSAKPFVGRWQVGFSSSDDPAVAVFTVDGDRVAGTFLTTTGDYRFLDGGVRNGKLELSCFDGGHAFLFRAEMTKDGSLAGDFWSSNTWHETWTAKKNPKASLPDSFTQTISPDGSNANSLRFPDLQGELTSINDPKFAGKARIIYVFGSWCPNCHDAAAYFAELQDKYGKQGLSILGLAFELTGEFERDVKQVQIYSKRHGVSYPVLIAGLSDKKEASKALPILDRVRSYPTTIFMDRNNQIRAVHTGFSGPATGNEYDELKSKFETIIEGLLMNGEKVPAKSD